MSSEIVLPFPPRPEPVRNVRSTVLIASLTSLRELGQEAAWRQRIDPVHGDRIAPTSAGVMLPVEVAVAHYRAIDALGLTVEEISRLGASVFRRVGGTLLGTMVELARGVGVNPWTLDRQLQRFWRRAYDGGAVQVVRLAAKEAELELVQCALLDTRYDRLSLVGHLHGMTELFARRVFLRGQLGPARPGRVVVRAQWV